MENITGAKTEVSTKTNKFQTIDKEIVVPFVQDGGFDILKTHVKDSLGNLVFRRVTKVATGNYLNTTFTAPDEKGGVSTITMNDPSDMPEFSSEEVKRNVGENYEDFAIFTSNSKIRKENDTVKGEIYGHSTKYSDFDLVNFDFYPVNRTMKPREGDLVCGTVKTDVNGENAQYEYWFVCSEQFLRFWTLIMFENHISFQKILDKNNKNTKNNKNIKKSKTQKTCPVELRRKVLSGNHLMPSGFRKWLLSCQQTRVGEKRIESERNEIFERFWLHRTEWASSYVHIYTALVMILRYGELPCENNVPNNLNNGPYMTHWDLPEGWLASLCQGWGLRWNFWNKLVQVPVLDSVNPPKGTHFVVEDQAPLLGKFEDDGDELFIPCQNFDM